MALILTTALVVGGATLVGAALGFGFRSIPQRLFLRILAAATGIMLAAAITGLILPSLTRGGRFAPAVTVAGVFAGALGMRFFAGLLSRLNAAMAGSDRQNLMFLAAMLIHKFPEGLAAGVGFGTGDAGEALVLAGGIALQNIPEGMLVILPMLSLGMRPGTVAVWSLATALAEALATLAGYWAVTLVSALLPIALAFAGGTMLYVLLEEMLPQTQESGDTLAVLAGFCAMLVCSAVLG